MRAALLMSLVGLACSSPAPVVKMPNPDPTSVVPPPAPSPGALDGLVEGRAIQGFIPTALYAGADGKPLGARFVHAKTKFVFDYLRIESAPQGFLWVKSYPTSDKGEPHTQEHLLLGKGNRGRTLGSSEAMALAESSAFTDQWRTCYHFHTVAGTDVYWGVFADHLDAMLNPDYTDEEIRREVRNFGVDKGDDGTLRLEEKGTVYNEMVRTYESPATVIWRAALRMVYGKQHPLAFESGGYPDDIRAMTVGDIRAFHTATHHLGNMGMVGAYPSTMPLAQVLDRTAQILEKAAGRTGATATEADLPRPAAAPAGTIELVDYPFATTTNPGPLMLVYPATRTLDSTERIALTLFLGAFASDESTPLYKKLVDGKTRVLDTGANGVFGYASDDQGQPVIISLDGVRSEQLDAKLIEQVRALVRAEFEKLAKLPDGSPALVAFNRSVISRITDLRRQLGKSLDTPPGFGIRGTGSGWMNLLDAAQRSPGFAKSLVFERELAAVEQLARGTTN
ncbi:MAG: hypothetical protein H0T79_05325, partial [Deltaproteobacteria bacterium]|nr:hypothetical protein [Deltaproteobacteria bacterium]